MPGANPVFKMHHGQPVVFAKSLPSPPRSTATSETQLTCRNSSYENSPSQFDGAVKMTERGALYQCFEDSWVVSGQDVNAPDVLKKTQALQSGSSVSFLLQPALPTCRRFTQLRHFAQAVLCRNSVADDKLNAALWLLDQFTHALNAPQGDLIAVRSLRLTSGGPIGFGVHFCQHVPWEVVSKLSVVEGAGDFWSREVEARLNVLGISPEQQFELKKLVDAARYFATDCRPEGMLKSVSIGIDVSDMVALMGEYQTGRQLAVDIFECAVHTVACFLNSAMCDFSCGFNHDNNMHASSPKIITFVDSPSTEPVSHSVYSEVRGKHSIPVAYGHIFHEAIDAILVDKANLPVSKRVELQSSNEAETFANECWANAKAVDVCAANAQSWAKITACESMFFKSFATVRAGDMKHGSTGPFLRAIGEVSTALSSSDKIVSYKFVTGAEESRKRELAVLRVPRILRAVRDKHKLEFSPPAANNSSSKSTKNKKKTIPVFLLSEQDLPTPPLSPSHAAK
eukprot:gene87-824_t